LSHPDFRLHNAGLAHPERAARLDAVEAALQRTHLLQDVEHIPFAPATEDDLLLCHTPRLIAQIRRLSEQGGGSIDRDTTVSASSFEVARLAVGATMKAVDTILEGKADNAFVASRPPGHHAESDQAMGFCLFNHVAIAARHAQRSHGLERVAILDWDVHHGNGTQEIFYDDGSVFFASAHESPLYPYTGAAEERGAAAGLGRIFNLPLAAGSDDADYETAWRTLEAPLREFAPQLILLSAGFDAHERDPLAHMEMTSAGFGLLAAITREWAREMCDNRLVCVLEGGYDLQGLSESAVEVIEVLLRD
jgi:acetoin utilization deacetylase AcuC-like enzyme